MLVHAFLTMEMPCTRRTRYSSTVRGRGVVTGNHSPQGVETGDLRSSRHMPQVTSDMCQLTLFPALSADDTMSRVGRLFGSTWWIGMSETETRRGDDHVCYIELAVHPSPMELWVVLYFL